MYERALSSGPTLRHEVKETAIGRRCARKRKGETANEAGRGAGGGRESKGREKVSEGGCGDRGGRARARARESGRERET